MPGLSYLADTNILLRLIKSERPGISAGSQGCPRTQRRDANDSVYVPQNIVEFWNVCTRPPDPERIRPFAEGGG